jgi:hypothetical protein
MLLARDKSQLSFLLPRLFPMFNKQWTTVASRQILLDSVEHYRSSFGHERASVISNAVKKIQDLADESGENVPASLETVNAYKFRTVIY